MPGPTSSPIRFPQSTPPRRRTTFLGALLALIVSAAALGDRRAPGAEEQLPPAEQSQAVAVFNAQFAPPEDANFDQWPDGWLRHAGPGFPRYLPLGIVEEPSASDRWALRLQLDGGNAAIHGPPFPASPLFSYVVEARVLTEGGTGAVAERRRAGLTRHRAFCTLSFHDREERLIGRAHRSAEVRVTNGWQELRIGPITPPPEAVSTRLGLHLEAEGRGDLFGAALFDSVRVARLPRMAILPARPRGWFFDPAEGSLRVEVSGILEAELPLELELRDVDGKVLERERRILAGKRETSLEAEADNPQAVPTAVYSAAADWHLPLEDFGFYEARVTMNGLTRRLPIVVLPPAAPPAAGEFGWTLPPLDDSLPAEEMVGLIAQAGLNWVKLPVWHGDGDRREAEQVATLADRLAARQIRLVGVLDQPPGENRHLFSGEGEIPVASVFLEPSLWQPVVDPVMTRLSLRVQWWQLGADGDTSFAGHPQLRPTIDRIRRHMNRFGQEVRLGLSWPWLEAPPAGEDPPWAFLMMREETPFTERELATYLNDAPTAGARWVSVQPLPRDAYDLPTRLRDLVLRMVAAKQGGATGIFVSEPFHDRRGLVHRDGSPSELLPAWRTTATLLAGARYLGSLNLPGGSRNVVFDRGDDAVMVLWSERERVEKLYLGDDVRQVDVWGRERTHKLVAGEQTVRSGPMPVFITGLSVPVARWRMDFQFENRQLASVFGRPQAAVYRFRNHFPQGVGGDVLLNTPSVWDAHPRRVNFRLMPGEEAVRSLEVLLRNDASSGPQPLRIDFDITAERNYKFSVYRTIEVGLGDVTIELSTRRNEQGDLIVEQQLTNHTDEFLSFNCVLRAPRRRRMRERVLNVGRGTHHTHYVIPSGDDLLGESLWLQAEEIDGERMLNYRFTVE